MWQGAKGSFWSTAGKGAKALSPTVTRNLALLTITWATLKGYPSIVKPSHETTAWPTLCSPVIPTKDSAKPHLDS